jgi:1-acyl-sn-glycerol-3-phosphate acyltransferase
MTAQTRKRMHWVYYFGRVIIHLLVFPFANRRVRGRENLPKDQPALIVCNHLHLADPPVIAASIPIKCQFMAKEDLWQNRWTRFWVANFGAFPVKRGSLDTEAIRSAERALGEGFSVIMFPEGGRSPNGQMQQAMPGAALIAARMKTPLLPVSITGSEKLRNFMWCVFHRPTITVTIGKRFELPPSNGKTGREQRREMADFIMEKIAEILPPEYQGVYGAKNKTGN